MKIRKVEDRVELERLVGACQPAHVWVSENKGWMIFCGPQLSDPFEDTEVISINQLVDGRTRTMFPYVIVEHNNEQSRRNLAFSVACVLIKQMLLVDEQAEASVRKIPRVFSENYGRLLIDGVSTYCALDLEKMKKDKPVCES